MFEGFTHGITQLDEAEIAWSMGGDGPPLLLLHGFPQCRALWARVTPELARSYTVVCADLRGYGDSTKPVCAPDHANYAFRAMARDQLKLMQALGFARFHLAGHDRGARVAHRLALDYPETVRSLALMDIIPTHHLLSDLSRQAAQAYWHWFFLAQPAPFPERLIGADPDYFFETCLLGWGGAQLTDFDPAQLAAYRKAWQDPTAIHGMCSDYRAAPTIDLANDSADLATQITCPALVLYGAGGVMGQLYDVPATWAAQLPRMQAKAMPGGHFFIDQHPAQTAESLHRFLGPLD